MMSEVSQFVYFLMPSMSRAATSPSTVFVRVRASKRIVPTGGLKSLRRMSYAID